MTTRLQLRPSDESGFTLVEVLVAILVLVIGVLGSVKLVDAATHLSLVSKQREGANQLAREIIEAARAVDYDSLTPSKAYAALSAQPGLADIKPSTAGWQIIRRGTTYTVNNVDSSGNMTTAAGNATPCAWDDPKDGTRSNATTDSSTIGGLACSGLSSVNPALTPGTGGASPQPCGVPLQLPCLDSQPDDYRRLRLDISWVNDGFTRTATQTAAIVNPDGGLGPRISSVTPSTQKIDTSASNPPSTLTSAVVAVVADSSAQEIDWSVDDATNDHGTATFSSGTWTITWNIGTAGTTGAVVDGTYTMSIQAFDVLGTPGDLKTATISLNRSTPVSVGTVSGGRDDVAHTATELIDLSWPASVERDIVGYHVYRVGTPDTLVCDTTQLAVATQNFCADQNLPSGTTGLTSPSYYVKAVDRDTSGNPREGAASPTFSPGAIDQPPTWPNGAQLTTSLGTAVTLTWPQAADPNNGNAAPLFYRIYRNGSAYANRYDRTGNGSQLTFVDNNVQSGSTYTYTVTPVSQHYEEGLQLTPQTVTVP